MTISTILTIFDNVWQVWHLLKSFIMFDNFYNPENLLICLTILTFFWQFYIYGQFWQFRQFFNFFTVLTLLTILNNFDNVKDNPRDFWPLRHWLQFWQSKTWIHDNLYDLTIMSDTGRHSQFLRCLYGGCFSFSHLATPQDVGRVLQTSLVLDQQGETYQAWRLHRQQVWNNLHLIRFQILN